MFSSWRRLPEISIFHNPSSPPSKRALDALKKAVSMPYPSAPTPVKGQQPLSFNLSVVENPPTKDQLRTILSYLPGGTNPGMALLSAHPSASTAPGDVTPSTLDDVAEFISKNPKALKWPIVVDWEGGKASVGDDKGVNPILERLRKERDGE